MTRFLKGAAVLGSLLVVFAYFQGAFNAFLPSYAQQNMFMNNTKTFSKLGSAVRGTQPLPDSRPSTQPE